MILVRIALRFVHHEDSLSSNRICSSLIHIAGTTADTLSRAASTPQTRSSTDHGGSITGS